MRYRSLVCVRQMGLLQLVFLSLALGISLASMEAGVQQEGSSQGTNTEVNSSQSEGKALLGNIRQLTFDGRRSGEGYFSRDGLRFIFQSEREDGNPFFQIYVMDRVEGKVRLLSPGYGKTTCGWIHPSGKKVLFSSTHEDPSAREKQKQELKRRALGRTRRYSWDFDPQYEIYTRSLDTAELSNLTGVAGYDAEGSWSPDGRFIVFASNRLAYEVGLGEEDKLIREQDPSLFVDLYLMRSDGSDVRRLTAVHGYDGGPFFSPSGQKICWRRFSPDGLSAEIFLMDSDGGRQRQITQLGKMSWAPFFHPSGDYLIFTTNVHGLDNFELYLTDVQGNAKPVRVTWTPGFDGLPVFSPDGEKLTWTTNRTPRKNSQIFLADWDDRKARRFLGIPEPRSSQNLLFSQEVAQKTSDPKNIRAQDLRVHVEHLASEEMEGRMTGTRGELLATEYIASVFTRLGLEPGGDEGSFFQSFPFTSGVSLGLENKLVFIKGEETKELQINQNWRPLAFSKGGSFSPSEVVFAGYGIVAPRVEGNSGYNSFAHLDVTDKWVMVLRYFPEKVSPDRRRHLARYGSLRYKAIQASDRGAKGLLIASGPNSKVSRQLIPLRLDGSVAGNRLPIISITDRIAQLFLDSAEKTLGQLQDELDAGEPQMGFLVPGLQLESKIDLEIEKKMGRNVLGVLRTVESPTGSDLIIGAHLDHLGMGATVTSLARSGDEMGIHYGADDNASGVAAVLELAEYLVDLRSSGHLVQKRDLVFGLWSGEELGLLGSGHFVKKLGLGKRNGDNSSRKVAAYLNLDMVGRLKESLVVQGVGSSSFWLSTIERANLQVGLPVLIQQESYLPTDATSFYVNKVPILSFFTGSHEDYHTPGDRAEKINYQGARRITQFLSGIVTDLLEMGHPPDYQEMQDSRRRGDRSSLRAYIGTIPDYSKEGAEGLVLSGVSAGGPAEKGGVRGGDEVVKLADREIKDIYDYTYAIDFLEIGASTEIVIVREGKRITLTLVPQSRE